MQLSVKYGCSVKAIQRRIDQHNVSVEKQEPREEIVLMDTTYWGRNLGIMLFKDEITKENLLKYYVQQQTNSVYIQGIEELKKKGFKILGVVCDRRNGLI